MNTAMMLFRQYSGHGMIVTLFLIALLYLWFTEKNNEKRCMLVYFPIGILAIFFFPLMVFVSEKFSEEGVLWRVLWSLPMMMVIAYAAVLIVRKSEGIKRYLTIAGVILLIFISGDYLYDNPNHLEAENLQHLPKEVIAICDEIIIEEREVKAAFPSECLMYVPQYTALVHMPYGREMFLISDGAVAWNLLYEMMESPVIDTKSLAEELRANLCHYVVLRKNAVLEGSMEQEEWALYCETDQYMVYIDKNNDPHQW